MSYKLRIINSINRFNTTLMYWVSNSIIEIQAIWKTHRFKVFFFSIWDNFIWLCTVCMLVVSHFYFDGTWLFGKRESMIQSNAAKIGCTRAISSGHTIRFVCFFLFFLPPFFFSFFMINLIRIELILINNLILIF